MRASLIRHVSPLLDSTPHPPARVHTEGLLPHEGIRDESIEVERELPLMRDAALAWRAGAGDAYLKMATRYLDAWVTTYHPDFNPIDETNFDALIDTYTLIQQAMPPANKARATQFLRAWAQGYVERTHDARKAHDHRGSWQNNWQSHRVKLVTLIAVALEDAQLFTEARELYREQVAQNLRPDGEPIDFAERDALHYVVYDLEPLLRAALAARSRGENWYAADIHGASLETSVRWLRPYAAGEKQHEEFVHSTVAFDAKRAAIGAKGYAGPFDPKTAANVYWMASEFDAAYRALAQRLRSQPPTDRYVCAAKD
ncbi:alginate lyase family protein [Luteibacter rhizovicinus]|uniref:alginate lyase family protein n=1 Tax=Luteibacter rhizovicinus TaxID=242606 RepID=UPI001404BE0E|nr:alginate lyase family protein [Luteibacter rhizovicinus]